MITSMYKRQHGKTIYVYGDLNKQDVNQLKKEGWKIEQRDKPTGKHGIQQEGARPCPNADYAERRSKRRPASKPGMGRSANGSMTKQKRSS
ncbi:Uncharacterised protein [Lysinibacillus sphaericus]|nr:Uncharacterised protein [Lysinibacillus sphaericus]